ncbi:MAG: 3-deoxy-7-phosphoheptulonate synthase [Candidatus Binatia bacterium]|nr:3-deoxy-7-phosphoheptulonate synthase [Candidatus Binatia bacterium]
MIIILKPDVRRDSPAIQEVLDLAARYPGVTARVHVVEGSIRSLMEIYLIGSTQEVPLEPFQDLSAVERVVRISEKYRIIGRHKGQIESEGFQYQGITFDQETLHVAPGLCAVDTREHVDQMFAALQELGIQTSRMGAYKPRTSPYDFQGLGKNCLPYVFESAGKHDIKVIAMEITHESNIDEINAALDEAGSPTGVMVQIGTRNAQNFELLKFVGRQQRFPVLFKRGMGITLEESLNACEYVASEGNSRIILCLRGMKTNLGDPHRNFVDFAHVPTVKRLTRMPVCVDPSHSVGSRAAGQDGLTDIHHATAQGVVAGANLVLVDFHPAPTKALCDGPQALTLDELKPYLEDIAIVREAYEKRRDLAKKTATAARGAGA